MERNEPQRSDPYIGWRKAIPRQFEFVAILQSLGEGIVDQAGLARYGCARIGTAQIRELCRISEIRVAVRIGNSTGNDHPERSNRIRLIRTHARTQKTGYGNRRNDQDDRYDQQQLNQRKSFLISHELSLRPEIRAVASCGDGERLRTPTALDA